MVSSLGFQIANEAFTEAICLKDTACTEITDVEEDVTGTNTAFETSCTARFRKFFVNGTLDYTRITNSDELGEIRSVSAAEACVQIDANAGFVGGSLEIECPTVSRPCIDFETPPGFCPNVTTAPPIVECTAEV